MLLEMTEPIESAKEVGNAVREEYNESEKRKFEAGRCICGSGISITVESGNGSNVDGGRSGREQSRKERRVQRIEGLYSFDDCLKG